jgi:hypothetical protein
LLRLQSSAIFVNLWQKLWVYFGGPWNENAVIYSGSLEYFTTIGNILWKIGYFVVIWYIFLRFGISFKEISGNPGSDVNPRKTHCSAFDDTVRLLSCQCG